MNFKILPTVLLLTITAAPTRAEETADDLFARAAQLAETDLTRSRELYRVAALQYERAAQTQPAQRGPLLYNAGNAFFLAGENGRAVVAYRRAQPAMPGSAQLRDNLAFVRQQSGNAPEVSSPARLAALRFWRWNPMTQWLLLAASWLLFWTAMFRGQWSGRRWPRPVWIGPLAFAALMAGTLLDQHLQAGHRCRGVIVAAQVEARKGPNYGYAPAFNAALDAGLEGDVIGRQGDWLQLRFDADREGWVRRSAVEIWKGRTPGS